MNAMESVTLEGEVVKFLYLNPHSLLLVKVKNPDTGENASWTIEWHSANTLRRSAITADTLKPGDHVVVVGYPSREERRLYMVSITRPSDRWEWRRWQ